MQCGILPVMVNIYYGYVIKGLVWPRCQTGQRYVTPRGNDSHVSIVSLECTRSLSHVWKNLIEKSEAHEYINLIKTLALPFTAGK